MRWFPPKGQPSRHFTWAEVIRNSGYTRVPLGPLVHPNGIRFTPRRNARKQAAALEQVRAKVNLVRLQHGLAPTGLNILSWARSYQHNKDVGGASRSRHLSFDAGDIALQEIDRLLPMPNGRRIFDAILDDVYAKGGVGLYPRGGRHADTRGVRARWTSF